MNEVTTTLLADNTDTFTISTRDTTKEGDPRQPYC